MAFGFVVARFGLFLRLLSLQSGSVLVGSGHNALSTAIGILLVLIGVACMVLGAIQHRSYVNTLRPEDVPRSHDALYPISLSLVLAVLGVVLAVYLVI